MYFFHFKFFETAFEFLLEAHSIAKHEPTTVYELMNILTYMFNRKHSQVFVSAPSCLTAKATLKMLNPY